MPKNVTLLLFIILGGLVLGIMDILMGLQWSAVGTAKMILHSSFWGLYGAGMSLIIAEV
jgi:hypothetical protein